MLLKMLDPISVSIIKSVSLDLSQLGSILSVYIALVYANQQDGSHGFQSRSENCQNASSLYKP
jgi:hypothetical protein